MPDYYIGSSPIIFTKDLSLMVKHVPFKHYYTGSNPVGLTYYYK